MPMIQACDHCRNVSSFWNRYHPSKTELRSISINAQLCVYRDGMKSYVKVCCLYSYYFGNVDMMSTVTQQNIPHQLKIKSCKYVITENSSFQVYELQIKQSEKINDPNTSFTPEKIEVTRSIYTYPSTESYKILSKAAFEKEEKKKEVLKLKAQIAVESKLASCDDARTEYVYLIQERTAVVANQPIYKIGRTGQNNFDRFKGYAKGYKILLHVICDDCKNAERLIMDTFKSKYRQADEYGSEYFEGDCKKMIADIMHAIS